MSRLTLTLLTLILLSCSATFAQTAKTYSGNVTDSLGNGLQNAMVRSEANNVHAITDSAGYYEISLPEGAQVTVSYVGYQTLLIDDFKGGPITLHANQGDLSEVIVVGYGTAKKLDVTGAIDQINGEELAKRPIANVFQGLQGASPGLNITYMGGQPGSTPQLNVRGFASINDADGSPLIIIDGIASITDDLLRINPTDIETVTVLRDASSAAIYGARAAFGVILITTKSGKEGKQKVSYNDYFAISKRTILPDAVTDPFIYTKVLETSTNNTPWDYVNYESWQYDWARQRSDDPNSAPEVMVNPNDPSVWAYMGANNWNDYFFSKTNASQYHTISFSGAAKTANDKTINYLLSADYTGENGLLKLAKDDWKRYGLRGKLNFSPFEWLNIDNNFNAYQLERDQPVYNITDLYYAQPTDVAKNPDGTWSNTYAGDLAARISDGGRNLTTRFGFQNIIRGVATFLNGDLQITGDASFKRELWKYSYQYLPYSIGYGPDDVRTEGTPSSATETNGTIKQYVYDLYANYNKNFGKHAIKLTAGYNQEEYEWDPVSVTKSNLISGSVPYIGLATGDVSVSTETNGGYYGYAIRSFFGRVNYSYQDKYIFEANGRLDGSSRFPKDNRWGFFPSISGAWNVSRERFWEGIKPAISTFKLRASYGWLGNQSVSYFGYMQTLPVYESAYIVDGALPTVLGVAPSLSVDPDNYSWEKVATSNFGFDLGTLHDKINLGFDYYIRNTTGMLAPSQELPGVLGAAAPMQNSADLRTQGWEVSLSYNDTYMVGSKPFSLGAKLILSDSKSKITRYNNAAKTFSAAFYPGQTIGEIWGLVNDGIFTSDEEIDQLDESSLIPWGALSIVPGWPKYMDLDGDHVIERGVSAEEPKDLKIIGNSSPRYRIGFNLDMNWNNIDFSVFLQGVLKQDYYPRHYLYWGPFQQPYANIYPWNLDFYRGEAESADERTQDSKSYIEAGLADANPDAFFPILQSWLADDNDGNGLAVPQTKYLQSAAYVRVKNLTVGYTLPVKVVEKLKLSRVRIFFSGENLFEVSPIKKYVDPESISDGFGWEYPYQRKYSFGLNIDF